MERDATADPAQAWQKLADAIADAGRRLDQTTKDEPLEVRADGYRALNRALLNLLGRLEVDDVSPHLAPYNLWREKFFMDNPDYRYWLTEIAPGGAYRIAGRFGDAVFTSINVYEGEGPAVRTVARLTSDDITADAEGGFSVTLGGRREDAADGQWVEIPPGATMVWVRQFYETTHGDEGDCRIERLDPVPPPPGVEGERLVARLARSAMAFGLSSQKIIHAGSADDATQPNTVRDGSEWQGGAAYTEPGIHYQRGAWRLGPDEALVLEGRMAPARHMNILLYSRYLNSLDYRNRQVSLTGSAIATDPDGRFRIYIAGRDPGEPNWLDTEGRSFGLFVLRWLQPTSLPELPTARVVKLAGR